MVSVANWRCVMSKTKLWASVRLHGCWDIPKSVPSITLLGDGHRGAPRLREAVTALAKAGITPSWRAKAKHWRSEARSPLLLCSWSQARTAATILFATNGNRKKTTMLQSETLQLIRLLATDYRRETGFSIRDCIELASDHETPWHFWRGTETDAHGVEPTASLISFTRNVQWSSTN